MDKYLIQILKEVNTIIIPEIGAITIVNQATGEVMFMSFMKFDDGKLAAYIAEKENWELNDAKILVAKYVREIQVKLDKGESYDMYQFGSFTKNSGGEIVFTPWDKSSTAPSTPEDIREEVATEVEEVNEALKEITKEDTQNDSLEPVTTTIEINTEQTKLEDAVKEEIEEQPLTQEVITPIEKEVPQPVTEEEQWNDDLDVPPINAKKEIPKKPILEKTKKDKIKKKRGVGFYLLVALLVLLIGGGTYFGMNYNELKEHIPFLASDTKKQSNDDVKKEKVVEKENLNADETADETPMDETASVPEETIATEPIDVPTETASPIVGLSVDKSLPIQVIAGSFTEEANAARKVKLLKDEGYAAEVIGRYGGLYFVSIGSFNSLSEVTSNQDKISGVGKYWVFQK